MKLKEETVKRRYLYEGSILKLRCDDAVLPDGKPCKREIVEHSGGAAVLCVHRGKVALVRQFRYAYGEELLEIPAGKLNAGEDPALAAARELEEETGLKAGKMKLLFVLYPSPGYTDEKIYVYEAECAGETARHPDEGEFLDVEFYRPEEVLDMIADGRIRDAKTVAAALCCFPKN